MNAVAIGCCPIATFVLFFAKMILTLGITAMENPQLLLITIDANICHGKPCIRGLRYPVEFILELLSSGMSTEEILSDYNDLERDDILAVLLFATRLTQVKSIYQVTL